jgi:hypothetical protein
VSPMFQPKIGNRGIGAVDAVVSTVVGFIVLSLAITLVNNFQGNLTTSPQNAVPFNSLWPLAVAGVLILAVIMGIATVARR